MRGVNPPPRPHREAVVRYATPDIEILAPGDFVRCAVTDVAIPLDRLTYWSVELQEAYASAELMTRRWRETHA
jgi:hypothetical protein